jgi:hypothetical protein
MALLTQNTYIVCRTYLAAQPHGHSVVNVKVFCRAATFASLALFLYIVYEIIVMVIHIIVVGAVIVTIFSRLMYLPTFCPG